MTLEQENEELRLMLSWSLKWFNATARRGYCRDKYEQCVRLTKMPDPQEWRDVK